MNKNRSLTVLVVVLGVAVVLTGGLMASNMGFKLNRTLLGGTDPGSASGTQLMSLPYNRQVGIDTASQLFGDLGANVQNIQRYDTGNDIFVPYFNSTTPDFPLVMGEGLVVKMGTTTPYIIVGSHDPSAVIQLNAGGGGASASGTNLYAPPYHATAATASALFDELGDVQNIQRYDTANDIFVPYFNSTTPDFPLNPGEAYFVKMGTSEAYTPSHY